MAPILWRKNCVPEERGRTNDVPREGAEMALQMGRQTGVHREGAKMASPGVGRQHGVLIKGVRQNGIPIGGAKMVSPEGGAPIWRQQRRTKMASLGRAQKRCPKDGGGAK